MSARNNISASTITFATSPHMNAVSIFVAVVLGSSLIEFNELLFPPKLNSLAFWGILPIYYFGLNAWFGVMAWGRYTPFLDKPLTRIWIFFLLLSWASLLGLMYFASRLPGSLLGYMWCLVVLFIVMWLGCIYRHRDTDLPEPTRLLFQFGSLALVTAIAYSIWALVFPPVPYAASWVFVFLVFSIMVGYRVLLRMTHAWRPEERQVERD